MQKITPFFCFDNQAAEAVKFYTTIFRKSKVLKAVRYSDAAANASGQPKGSVMTIEFKLEGQRFMALNGGPHFKFNEAVSFVVQCKTQAEIDKFWGKLSAGGRESQCGWLKDKFGVSWLIVPDSLGKLISSKDPERSQRVMEALLKMRKLKIKDLKRAYEKKVR